MKKPLKVLGLLLISIFTLLAFKYPSQENFLLNKIETILFDYSENQGPEKTYVHTDKEFYTNGETIWFKTYLLDGISHTKSNKSNVTYVELVDAKDSLIAKRKLFTDETGTTGDIKLSQNIPQGIYTLRAYTKYMLNNEEPMIFQKEIPVVSQNSSSSSSSSSSLNDGNGSNYNTLTKLGITHIRFFPEGGDLVAGLATALGIEVTDNAGNGIALKGVIKDDNDKLITSFESFEFGLGKINFKPSPQKKYYAHVQINGKENKYPLPLIKQQGYGLSIKNQNNQLYLQALSTSEKGLEGTILVGHLRGKMIYKRLGKKQDKQSYAVRLHNNELLDGVAQFTLFTANGEAACERLVFIDNPTNDITLTIRPNAEKYGLREKVALDIALTDTFGKPINGDLSIGVVTNTNTLENKTTNTDIRSWLLLNSDLGGTVQDPGFFFADDSKKKKYLLDALMLTHGWRRFVWTDILADQQPKVLEFQPEKGIMITGNTTAFYKRSKVKKTITTLSIPEQGILQEIQATTNEGVFAFGPFVSTDSLHVIIQARDTLKKGKIKQKEIAITIDNNWSNVVPIKSRIEQHKKESYSYNNEYLRQSYIQKKASVNFNDQGITKLDEVIVTEKKKTRDEIITEVMGADLTSGIGSRRTFMDSFRASETSSVMDILGRLPGAYVTGSYPNQIFITGGYGLYLLDGIEVGLEYVQGMRANEVLFVDTLKRSYAASFGSRGAVCALYSDRGYNFDEIEAPKETPGIINVVLPGFYKSREFYTPNYNKKEKNQEKPDFRTTLFWEPNFEANENGSSTINFFTGDTTGSYIVKIEGVTSKGQPVSAVRTIEVVNAN